MRGLVDERSTGLSYRGVMDAGSQVLCSQGCNHGVYVSGGESVSHKSPIAGFLELCSCLREAPREIVGIQIRVGYLDHGVALFTELPRALFQSRVHAIEQVLHTCWHQEVSDSEMNTTKTGGFATEATAFGKIRDMATQPRVPRCCDGSRVRRREVLLYRCAVGIHRFKLVITMPFRDAIPLAVC